jgi:O-succinylbenzoic acid--CoA ligase
LSLSSIPEDVYVSELVMLDLPAGAGFVNALQRVWNTGDAVFPLDQRLPKAEADRVIAVAKPTAVIGPDGGRRALGDGEPVEKGDAVVVATSGTTGHPKAVIHTHTSVAASAHATSDGLGADPTTDRWLACLPPAHIGGLAVIMRSLITGTDLVVHETFDPTAADQAAVDGATLVSLVTRALNQVDIFGFRKVLIGGAAPPPDLPDHVIATYGMTETGSGCVYDGYPIDGVELRAAANGDIEIKADLLLRAYRTVEGEIDPFSVDGWFPTGDLGRVDPDGRLWIDGRAGDMIITGGENVWPHRIERVLETHPAIAEVAVIGRPDPDWGHRVVAVIVPALEMAPSLDEIRDYVRAELPAWNAPKEIVVVDALPKTALGKIRKSELSGVQP